MTGACKPVRETKSVPNPDMARKFAQTAGLTLGLIALLAVLFFTTLHPPDDVAIAECRNAYARARSAQDSAAVDFQRPITSRPQAGVAVDCRTLRLAKRLAQK